MLKSAEASASARPSFSASWQRSSMLTPSRPFSNAFSACAMPGRRHGRPVPARGWLRQRPSLRRRARSRHGDAAPLARQAIAAARPAHALQDAGAHQRLHHLLEIAVRQPWPRVISLACTGWPRAWKAMSTTASSASRSLFGTAAACQPVPVLPRPVEPKPPSPRAVADSVDALDERARHRRDHELRDAAPRGSRKASVP